MKRAATASDLRLRNVRALVGLTELLGGLWSAYTTLALLNRFGGILRNLWFAAFALGFFTIVCLAGIMLLRGRESGVVLSYGVQAVQSVQITFGSFALRFLAGPHLILAYFGGDDIRFFLGVTSAFNVLRSPADPSFGLGLNLAAFVFLGLLWWGSESPANGGQSVTSQ